MTIKLTPASFLMGIRQSGLLDSKKFDAAVADLERQGIDQQDAAALAAALVKRGVLTDWQAEKLLQGRHKGFMLGRYKLLSLLGAGEMSAVYLAEHTLLERRCAIKVLPGNRVKDTSYLARFHREAKAVASLNHPNIVRAYDVDKQVEGGIEVHFLVMEFVEGRNLEKIVSLKGPLRYVDAAECMRQAAEGLSHAHQAGLVHRDIKPENLLVDNQSTVKILDLGLARLFEQTDEESLTIKHDEKVLGTADYLAPEQAIDSHKVDARADIYSLGCTFYFTLTGHPPFTEGTLVQRLFAHQTKMPKPVSEERPDAPAGLMAILDKMMAKKSADRYQSAAEVAQALTRWLAEHGGRAWQTRHVALMATVYGMEAISQKTTAAAQKTAGALAGTTGSGRSTVSKARPAPTQPELYTTNGPRSAGATATAVAEAPPRALTSTDDKTSPVEADAETRRQPFARTAQPNAARRSAAATRSKTLGVTKPASPDPQTKPTAEKATRANAALNDAQVNRTRWMIAWLGLTSVAAVSVSAFLLWFFQTNADMQKPTDLPPTAMVIGG